MSSIDILSSITEIVGAGNVLMDEQMKCHTTFRVGGPADFFVKPQNERQLAGVIRYLDEYKIPFFILGNGSNLLVSDSGYRGVIIDLSEGFDESVNPRSVTRDDPISERLLNASAVTAMLREHLPTINFTRNSKRFAIIPHILPKRP